MGTIQERIVVDPQICGGKPCIRGTRIMVKNILGMLAGGYDMEQILHAYPELSREDVVAAATRLAARATSRLRSYWIRTFRDRSANGCGRSILAGGSGTWSRWAWLVRPTARYTSGHRPPKP